MQQKTLTVVTAIVLTIALCSPAAVPASPTADYEKAGLSWFVDFMTTVRAMVFSTPSAETVVPEKIHGLIDPNGQPAPTEDDETDPVGSVPQPSDPDPAGPQADA